MMVNLILTALKGKLLYHQIQFATLYNDQLVMDWMFLIYGVMQRQVSEYGTHYNLVVKIIAWIQFFLGLILTYLF